MDILKRIDQAQQFCKFYADGAYSIETEKWNYHVTPELIEDIRQYIESLQLKLMHLQTQQAHKSVCAGESYDMIDRFLRNNLDDDNYAEYSAALDELCTPPTHQESVAWVDVKDTHHGPYEFHGKELLPVGKHDLYTAQQPAQRKPLSDDEIWKFWWSRPEVPEGEDDSMEAEFVAAVRQVLAAHGIGEKK